MREAWTGNANGEEERGMNVEGRIERERGMEDRYKTNNYGRRQRNGRGEGKRQTERNGRQ